MNDEEKARLKEKRTKIRRARLALRKLETVRLKLESLGEITDWEKEFISSVSERLDKYDAAFANPALGGKLEALSGRQKQVLAQMRRKIKEKNKEKIANNYNHFPTQKNNDSNKIIPDNSDNEKTNKKTTRAFLQIIDGGKS